MATEKLMQKYLMDNKPTLVSYKQFAQNKDRFKKKMQEAMKPIDYEQLAGTDNSHVGILLQFGAPPLSKETNEFISWMLNNLRQASIFIIIILVTI